MQTVWSHIQDLSTFTGFHWLGLADAVHPADGLQLVGRVEDGLDQQHVRRLDDVQAVGARVERQEQDVDLLLVFEGAQVLLETHIYSYICVRQVIIIVLVSVY